MATTRRWVSSRNRETPSASYAESVQLTKAGALLSAAAGGRHVDCSTGGVIEVTRFNDSKLILNALLIERVEQTPDTVITLTSGRQFVVKETPEQLRAATVEYLRSLRDDSAARVTVGEVARLVG